MWKHIEGAMLAEITELTSSGRLECYDRQGVEHGVGEHPERLQGLQTQELTRNQESQRAAFEKAAQARQAGDGRGRGGPRDRDGQKLQQDLSKLQAIERENEHEMLIAVPPRRYSKRVLELGGDGLSAPPLRRGEERPARMTRSRRRSETTQGHRGARRKTLDKMRADQESQSKRLGASARPVGGDAPGGEQAKQGASASRTSTSTWSRPTRSTATQTELVVHPSALLRKRPHHDVTSSTLNGKRPSLVLGKKKDGPSSHPLRGSVFGGRSPAPPAARLLPESAPLRAPPGGAGGDQR